jgi:hypothetical protein
MQHRTFTKAGLASEGAHTTVQKHNNYRPSNECEERRKALDKHSIYELHKSDIDALGPCTI